MRKVLDDFLEEDTSSEEATIRYHIGVDFTGETDFKVDRAGHYAIESNVTSGRVRRRYDGKVDAIKVRALVDRMIAERLWEVHHVSGPGDDDPEVRIEVALKNTSAGVALWLSEVQHNESFRSVQSAILELVHEGSRGEVLENGS